MEALLNDETLSEVTFVVGDVRIHALRAVLISRSEYFRAMLTSGFDEGQEAGREITIGSTTPEAFKAILRYLYTDELRFPDEHLMEVMHKAKEIQLERVYKHAVGRASRLLSVHNVVNWLVKADEYGMEELRTAALTFFTRNLPRIKAEAKQSLQGLSERPQLMVELISSFD